MAHQLYTHIFGQFAPTTTLSPHRKPPMMSFLLTQLFYSNHSCFLHTRFDIFRPAQVVFIFSPPHTNTQSTPKHTLRAHTKHQPTCFFFNTERHNNEFSMENNYTSHIPTHT